MKWSRIALAVLFGVIAVILGVSVVSFSAARETRDNKTAIPAAIGAMPVAEADNSSHHVPLQGKVSGVKKTSNEANLISLKWDKFGGAAGYYVYVCGPEDGNSFVLLSTVHEPAAELMNLKDGTPYQIKVSAFKQSNGVVYESAPLLLKTATQPADVATLDSLSSDDVLKFCWPKSDTVAGYDIYRADEKTKSKFVLYKSLGKDASSFEDKNVEEGDFYSYKVCPYLVLDNVKYAAKGKKIDFISGLGAPENLIARSGNTRVTLHWDENDLADGYDVYISNSENSGFKHLGSTDENSYATDKLEAGKTYYFRVQPYKTLDKKSKAHGNWSACNIKASKSEGSSDSPKSSISGKGTFIEISIDQQHMWFYEKGKLLLDTDIVTGNKNSADTPTGSYAIQSRARDTTLTGEGYSSFVNYWMGFSGGYGIHDASWRSSFGGEIYSGNGSHGCVNTPFEKVKIIYEHTDYGTPVFIY